MKTKTLGIVGTGYDTEYPPRPLRVGDLIVDDVLHCMCGARHSEVATRRFGEEVGTFWFGGMCEECDANIDDGTVVVPVRTDSVWALDIEAARCASWYHFTTMEDWPKFRAYGGSGLYTDENFWAHVGSLQAARDRRKAMTSGSWGSSGRARILEVRIKDDTWWSPDLVADDGNVHGIECLEGQYQAVRYLNKFESPGSISVAVCNENVEVIREVE